MSFGINMFCRATRENVPKWRNQEGAFKQNRSKPIQTPHLGQNTSVGAIQAQPATHQSKVVVSGLA